MARSDALAVGFDLSYEDLTYHEDFLFGLRCKAAGLHGHFDRCLTSEHLFVGSLPEFRRDAFAQGVSRVRLEHALGGQDGAAARAEACLCAESGAAGRMFLGAANSDSSIPLAAAAAALQSVVALTGLCRAYSAQAAAARWLQRFDQGRGIKSTTS